MQPGVVSSTSRSFPPNTVRCSNLILPVTVALGEPLICMLYSVSAVGWAALVIELHSQQSIQFQQAFPLPQAPPQYSSADDVDCFWCGVHALLTEAVMRCTANSLQVRL
jgi:hypothetical protein